MPAFQDLTGERFERLMVVMRDPDQRDTYWICRCDCGAAASVRAGNLTGGQVRSCGCLQREKAKADDMTGRKFAQLTVIGRAETINHVARWTCLCDCGTETVVAGKHLRGGNTKSCGCRRIVGARAKNRTHGMSKTLAYKRWESIRQRTTNPNNPSYRNYGARGIQMCDEWLASFEAFHAAVGDPPSPELSLDRIDNDGNYEPGNVRWATAKTQMNNRQPYKRVNRAEMEAALAERDAEIAALRAELAALT